MKNLSFGSNHRIGLSVLFCVIGLTRAFGGGCAVSEGSQLPSEDGCMLAFVYNQADDHRLVVLDEKNHQHYEAPLENSRMAPFWEDGKVYVVAHSGDIQGFQISSNKLVGEKKEVLTQGVLRTIAYARGKHRLYLIRTFFDEQRQIHYELSTIEFPSRKTLWTKSVDDPGLLQPWDNSLCMIGLESVQVFNSDTGERIGKTEIVQSKSKETKN
jgi:hypothetical protein